MRIFVLLILGLSLCCTGPTAASKGVPSSTAPSAFPFGPGFMPAAPKPPEPELEPAIPGQAYAPLIDFTGEVDDASVEKTIKLIKKANEKNAKAIVIEFNTPGGGVDAGLLLAKAIERSVAPVHCIVDGDAMSMGFYLLQSCTTRTMTDRSVLMTHEPALYMGFGGGGGQKNYWKRYYDMLSTLAKAMNRHQARRLNISFEEYCDRIDGKDWYMEVAEAREVRAVDRVVESVGYMLRYIRTHGGEWPIRDPKSVKRDSKPKGLTIIEIQ